MIGIIEAPLNYFTAPGRAGKKSQELNRIYRAVINHLGADEKGVLGKSRTKEFTTPRMIYCYLAYLYTNISLEKIGMYVNRDHSTVLASTKRIQGFVDIGKESICQDINIICNKLNLYDYQKIRIVQL